MTAWWALLRRARRLAVRSPWRTLWTGALVFAAVLAGSVAMADAWGHHLRSGSAGRAFGAADAVYAAGPAPDATAWAAADALRAALPEGAEMATEQRVDGLAVVRAGGGWYGSAHLADWDDPILDGVLTLADGRPPGPGEVVLSPSQAQATGLRVGDEMLLVGSSVPLVVVGIGTVGTGDDGMALTAGELVADDGSSPAASTELRFYVRAPSDAVLPPGPDIPGADGQAGTSGIQGPSGRDEARRMSPDAFVALEGSTQPLGVLVAICAGVVVAVGLLAGAAFGIGARRRSRATGLLTANGADDGQLRLAAAAEAVVIAAPAAVLGVVVALVVPPLWTRLGWPGWVAMTDAVLPWAWAAITVVAAVAVAAIGAVVFSASARARSTSSMLDEREPGRRSSPGPQRIGWVGWLSLGVVGWAAFNLLMGVVVRRNTLGGVALLAAVLLWGACAFGSLRLARVFLRRDAIGRLVDRDLARQRIGSIATVVVVATWVFVAVGGTATEWFESTVNVWAGEPSGAGEPRSAPTTVAVAPPDGPPGPTPTPDPSTPPEAATTVLIRSSGPSGPAGWVVRGSVAPPGAAPGVPDGLAAELADAGLTTQRATFGQWEGPCPVCPEGFVPTVLVLEDVDGLGLPPTTAEYLRTGAAVTPFAVPEVADQQVVGAPVRTAPLPFDANAAVLAGSAPDGAQLTDATPALVGSAARLNRSQAERIVELVRDAGLELSTEQPELAQAWWDATGGGVKPGDPTSAKAAVWPWLAVLVLVTLVATAAHRREHGEVARVLRVLGAPPRADRRLASLTAGSLAGVGVGLGLTAAVVVVAVSALRRGTDPVLRGLWNAEATYLLLAALAVPLLVALLAGLLPPSRSRHDRGGAMPA